MAVKASLPQDEVQDQGEGIAPGDQIKLLQPYHRVEQDRPHYPGMGLALAVCKQIMEAHGGTIAVENEVGRGTTFQVRLPVGLDNSVEGDADGRGSNPNGEKHIAVKKIAEYCMVSPGTVRRWLRDGKLTSIRLLSSPHRIRVSEFKAFLECYKMPIKEEFFNRS